MVITEKEDEYLDSFPPTDINPWNTDRFCKLSSVSLKCNFIMYQSSF